MKKKQEGLGGLVFVICILAIILTIGTILSDDFYVVTKKIPIDDKLENLDSFEPYDNFICLYYKPYGNLSKGDLPKNIYNVSCKN